MNQQIQQHVHVSLQLVLHKIKWSDSLQIFACKQG